MIENWVAFLRPESFTRAAIGVLDVVVVAVLVYRTLLVLKGTRALQMGFGIVLILLTYLFARWVGLVTLENLFSYLLPSLIIIIVVVFQNDIRRALTRIGSSQIFGRWGHALETRVVDEVVAATTELARHRTGALITFEQDANLDEFVVGQGTVIDSVVSKELLVTTFIPESMNKLHDGAVIIRNLRIVKAGVFFPMPEAKHVDAAFGSRHRAAIGITEETDAVVIAVSEERGTISFCFNGNIVTDLDGDVLRRTLLRIFGRTQKQSGSKKKSKDAQSETVSRVSIGTPPPPRVAGVTNVISATMGNLATKINAAKVAKVSNASIAGAAARETMRDSAMPISGPMMPSGPASIGFDGIGPESQRTTLDVSPKSTPMPRLASLSSATSTPVCDTGELP
ncbi:MAG: diadenylate cyclase CdaA [Polyangiaceae bacterium]|nr:diadenylate cyclase CdaA [Polyangiaceae bacterium]